MISFVTNVTNKTELQKKNRYLMRNEPDFEKTKAF